MDPWGLWSIGWRGRKWLEFNWDDAVEGVKTGLAGVGSAVTFGLYDGGRFRNEPGFGVSRGLAWTGIAAGSAAWGLAGGGAWALNGARALATRGTGWLAASLLPRLGQLAGLGMAAYQGLVSRTYMIGQWNNGQLAEDAEAAGAAILRLPDWAYSGAANRLWLWLVYARPSTDLLFASDPGKAINTFLMEMNQLRDCGCPF